jgi:hypothetical protein
MERDDLKNDLIAYLYGEMSTEERLRFEKEMESDPDLRNEFMELKQVRKGLSQLEDKEVMEPFFLWGRNSASAGSNPFRRKSLILFKPFIAVAASLVILLMVGYLTRFSISYQQDRLFIGFNGPEQTQPVDVLSTEEIRSLVRNEINQNNQRIFNTINVSENKMETRFATLETNQKLQMKGQTASNGINEKDLKEFYEQLQLANATLMENYLQNATVQQQEYFQTVMNQFTDYLQDQREEDLRIIRRNLVNLKENQDQQKQETQQILAAILNNANNQNN